MTDNIEIVIQCRDDSTRYKEKSVRPFYNGKSILELIVDRLLILNIPIILATTHNSPKSINIIWDKKVRIYKGDEGDVLGRIFDATHGFIGMGIIRICADNPFLQLPLLYPVIKFAETGEYDYVAFKNCMKRHEGFFAEYISINALWDAYLNSGIINREHVTPYIYNNPNKFKLKLLPIPDIMDLIPIRLTVDTESDFAIARKVYKYIGENHWSYIYDYVQHHPVILEAMKKNIERNPK